MAEELGRRKLDHIRICLEKEVEAREATTWLEHVWLIHQALPEADFGGVDLGVEFLGHRFSAPLMVSALTGGTEEAARINAAVAEAVEELGLGMGVGSQRIALEDPKLARTFRVVREKAPTAFIMANIGYQEVVRGLPIGALEEAISMVEADALAVHLNPLQEVVQALEGASGRELLTRLAELTESLGVPVVVKEVGSGLSAEVAKALEAVGVEAVDVAGLGGTSWAAVERFRALEAGDELRARLGEVFWDWGIPTAASILEVASSTELGIIASGGVRTGLDVAKCLALGADMAAMALPILREAVRGPEAVEGFLRAVMEELRTAIFLSGCRSPHELAEAPLVITGPLADWIEARGLRARRKASRP
ncbi:type 2 isopentenyl-diphosphate Delta-isomerase [Candidatus Bathyarchaeota archaeon]|nr:MAG: type 2 isopentenyl-diphosphate Delta-isomerase [Candidatus Bathyarchaeota archaeon]